VKPIVSIVSGTYNRLSYLQKMVDSVRTSVGIGIQYEIILVDGGSTDGTINWCKKQDDIVLIEHGKLVGPIPAFNDGARRAKGTYVILANDDIYFVDESIQAVLSFMEDRPDVGIGCFYQDRRGWDWHVEQMPAVVKGMQTSVYYGQVCIVPKWLGDMLGWWGNYLKYYGGDNELSANVLELGYKVSPVPCACIHDSTPADELRRINNDDVLVNGNHPDSQTWVNKWTRGNFVGPVVVDTPSIENPIKRTYRILYAPIYEKGHPIQKYQKRGLRDALSEIAMVSECDYIGRSVDYLYDLARVFRPDMFLIQAQSIGEFNEIIIRDLRKEFPSSVFVNWNGDYHPENLYNPEYMRMLKLFDMTGLVTTAVASRYNQANIHWFYWQIGYEESDAVPNKGTPVHDVLFLGNGYSDARLNLVATLRQRVRNFGLYGMWPGNYRSNGSTLYDFDSGAVLYKNCKIAIGDSQWPEATGFVSNRLFQAMAAGAFLLHQWFDGANELLGLEDGVHLVMWRDVNDLLEKIEYYLSHVDERKKIAKTGCDYITEYHSFGARVNQLINQLWTRNNE